MKVTVELYGATKDLSKNNFLEFDLKKNSSIKDIKIQILNLIEKSFEGNQNLKKLIEVSAFCSDKDEIISENYKINKNIDLTISTAKPPIFWKEKEITKQQIYKWTPNQMKELIYKLNEIELRIKKNLNNSVNLLTDFILETSTTEFNNKT